jgi:hypothetical protein
MIAGLVEEAERQAAIERKRFEEQHQQWVREEQDRKRAQNQKASREDLFAIIEGWAIAERIEEFFKDVETRSSGLVTPTARRSSIASITPARCLAGPPPCRDSEAGRGLKSGSRCAEQEVLSRRSRRAPQPGRLFSTEAGPPPPVLNAAAY